MLHTAHLLGRSVFLSSLAFKCMLRKPHLLYRSVYLLRMAGLFKRMLHKAPQLLGRQCQFGIDECCADHLDRFVVTDGDWFVVINDHQPYVKKLHATLPL